MNEQLPILLISGKDDPFGDYGKGIRKLGKKFKRAGINHITVQLYEIFEDEKEMIWSHMFEWIQNKC